MAKPERISEQDVHQAARLSRLRLSDEQVQRFTKQLGDVLDYVAKLNELDLEADEPLAAAVDLTNVLRDDAEKAGMTVEAALINAPQSVGPFFKVPKVLADASGG